MTSEAAQHRPPPTDNIPVDSFFLLRRKRVILRGLNEHCQRGETTPGTIVDLDTQ